MCGGVWVLVGLRSVSWGCVSMQAGVRGWAQNGFFNHSSWRGFCAVFLSLGVLGPVVAPKVPRLFLGGRAPAQKKGAKIGGGASHR